MSDKSATPSKDRMFFLEKHTVVVHDFESSGYILDIGGGGEGIIGILKGDKVIAIDFRKEELEEAAPGGLKIVMDARDLKFLDHTFDTATAFFSLMYLKSLSDYVKVFSEAWRVLEPGGRFLIWDVSIPHQIDDEKEIFVIPLGVQVGGKEIDTGYGQRWPDEVHDLEFYVGLAEQTSFRVVEHRQDGQVFFLELQKPRA